MIVIRRFQPDDTFSVIKIAHSSLPEQYNPIIFNTLYESFPEGFLVVEKHHKIIGFIACVITPNNIAKIPLLAIKKQDRRQHIGSTLIAQLFKELTQRHITQVELEVRSSNQAAIAFYKKHGFSIIKSIPKFYQNGEEAIIMKKHI